MSSILIYVGKSKEKHWALASSEYLKRLRRFANIDELALPSLYKPDKASQAQIQQILEKEGENILKNIKARDFVIALDIEGKSYTSEEFSLLIQDVKLSGQRLTFVIGGALGLSPQVLKRANLLFSLSKMTFPHQLARVLLLEQWYRGETIAANEKYHK